MEASVQPVLVLLHGWGMNHRVLQGLAMELSCQYPVLSLDLPGHGNGPRLETYDLDAQVQALQAELPDGPVVLIGWSLGGNLALELAARYPARIRGVIALACNPCFVECEDWPGMKAQFLQSFSSRVQTHPEQALQRFVLLQLENDEESKNRVRQFKTWLAESESPEPLALQAGMKILEAHDFRPTLGLVSCPVCFIQGDLDSLVPVAIETPLKKQFPDLKFFEISGAGHALFLSHSAAVIDAIKQCL
jgi:pimeloyl-[acyl-carrier protein] methyl ester esterase